MFTLCEKGLGAPDPVHVKTEVVGVIFKLTWIDKFIIHFPIVRKSH